jgi:hypothetical protein
MQLSAITSISLPNPAWEWHVSSLSDTSGVRATVSCRTSWGYAETLMSVCVSPLPGCCGASIAHDFDTTARTTVDESLLWDCLGQVIEVLNDYFGTTAVYATHIEGDPHVAQLRRLGFRSMGRTLYTNANTGNRIVTLRKVFDVDDDDD